MSRSWSMYLNPLAFRYMHSELDAYEKHVVKNKRELDAAIKKLQAIDERNKGIPLDKMGLYFDMPKATHNVMSKSMQDKIEDMDYFTPMNRRISKVDILCAYCGGHPQSEYNCVNCGGPQKENK